MEQRGISTAVLRGTRAVMGAAITFTAPRAAHCAPNPPMAPSVPRCSTLSAVYDDGRPTCSLRRALTTACCAAWPPDTHASTHVSFIYQSRRLLPGFSASATRSKPSLGHLQLCSSARRVRTTTPRCASAQHSAYYMVTVRYKYRFRGLRNTRSPVARPRQPDRRAHRL